MEKLLEVAYKVYVARPETEAKRSKKEEKRSVVPLAQTLQWIFLGEGGEVVITEEEGEKDLEGLLQAVVQHPNYRSPRLQVPPGYRDPRTNSYKL